MSKSRSKPRCRSARWWLAPRLTFEYHNQTGICFTNTRNYCHRNKIYVLTSLLKQIYLQSAECARIYCTVNTVCHSCYHHHKFTSRRTHEQGCGDCGFVMMSQLLPLTLSERTSHRQSNDAIWDLRHDLRRDSIESRWFSFVNMTWLGPRPSLKWDSVRVQAKSWVKSQVKTVGEYGPRIIQPTSSLYSRIVRLASQLCHQLWECIFNFSGLLSSLLISSYDHACYFEVEFEIQNMGIRILHLTFCCSEIIRLASQLGDCSSVCFAIF